MRSRSALRFASSENQPLHGQLKDGSTTFGYTRYVVPPQDKGADTKATRMVLADGLYENRRVFFPLMQQLIKVAREHGDGLDIMSYDEPLTGKTSYAVPDRAKRLASVVKHMCAADSQDRPVRLVGHSLGNASSVTAGPALVKAEQVEGIMSVGGVGYTPRKATETRVRNILALTARELGSSYNRHQGRQALPTFGTLVLHSAIHTGRNYPAAVREVKTILQTDLLEEGAALSQEVPMGVWALDFDPFCPGELQAKNLGNTAFRGHVQRLEASHAGPLVDRTLAEPLYNQVCSLSSVAV